MGILYVQENGAVVQHRSGRFIVRKEDTELQNIPETQVEGLVLMGKVNLTPDVISFCLRNEIDVAFLSSAGHYRGRLQGQWTKSAVLRQAQYQRSIDSEFRLRQAREVVRGKLNNMLAFARRQPATQGTLEPLKNLDLIAKRLDQAKTIDSLLGFEGSSAKYYFAAFSHWLPSPWRFAQRMARPV